MIHLSVIIPTYNSEEVIERCLHSLAIQSYKNFEICLIDGGSLDKTIDKVRSFESSFKALRIISEPDGGVYDAMNKGIKMSQGEWLYFLGSDDELYDETVFSDILGGSPPKQISLIYGNVYIKGNCLWANSGELYDGIFDIRKLLSKNICHQAIFYRRQLFKKFGDYTIKYSVCADWAFNLRVFPNINHFYVDRPIAIFHGGGISSSNTLDPIGEDLDRLRRKALKDYIGFNILRLFKFQRDFKMFN